MAPIGLIYVSDCLFLKIIAYLCSRKTIQYNKIR